MNETPVDPVIGLLKVQLDGHESGLWLSGFKPMNEFLDNNLIFYYPLVWDERGLSRGDKFI